MDNFKEAIKDSDGVVVYAEKSKLYLPVSKAAAIRMCPLGTSWRYHSEGDSMKMLIEIL
jgi:hypothetical protein